MNYQQIRISGNQDGLFSYSLGNVDHPLDQSTGVHSTSHINFLCTPYMNPVTTPCKASRPPRSPPVTGLSPLLESSTTTIICLTTLLEFAIYVISNYTVKRSSEHEPQALGGATTAISSPTHSWDPYGLNIRVVIDCQPSIH